MLSAILLAFFIFNFGNNVWAFDLNDNSIIQVTPPASAVVMKEGYGPDEIAYRIAQIIYEILLPLAGGGAIIMLVFGGFKYITSMGNDEAMSKAKKIILWAIGGLFLILFSVIIVRMVRETMYGLGG